MRKWLPAAWKACLAICKAAWKACLAAWKACLAAWRTAWTMVWKACLACLEGLSGWLEGWRWLGGRLAVESHTHDALGTSADLYLYIHISIYICMYKKTHNV